MKATRNGEVLAESDNTIGVRVNTVAYPGWRYADCRSRMPLA